MIEVTLPPTPTTPATVLRRLQQQVEDAHTAAIDLDNDEADRVVLFITGEYLKALELFD